MSTNSIIAVKQDDDQYETIYCHWDGYPTGVGASLLESYNSLELANQLVAGGDISSIAGQPDNVPKYYAKRGSWGSSNWGSSADVDEPWEDVKPTNRTMEEIQKWAKDGFCEYVYLFEDGEWKYLDRDWRLLILSGDEEG